MTDEEFLFRLESATLPRGAWNHAAHLRMAYLYLKNSDSWEGALPLVRERIRSFNAAHRNYSGYHETITAAFLRIVRHRMSRRGEAVPASFEVFSAENPDLFEGMAVLLGHYNKAVLLSPEARAGFIEPDRQPLP
jgi:hypothetical protein